ncbi:MAG: 4-beta-xylanase B [Candidatus Ordinivivax streblomastigis]|uniref:endo-1,4-beta-xylanase n=1 Tax=Candidatus Ordinivivax streblomastigis TaxID=2540710 RepID=A0A5M8NX45_9BACT|nr:MAG: 4-beta-xylanase B [Candidatus Ordinivivax streblomastigis]
MKKIYLLIAYLAILSITHLSAQTTLLTEGFEGSGGTFPSGWGGTTTGTPTTRPNNDAANAHSGNRYLRTAIPSTTGGNPWNYTVTMPNITVRPDHKIRLSFWMKTMSGTAAVRVSLPAGHLLMENSREGQQYLPGVTVTDTYTQFTYDVVYGQQIVTGGPTIKFTFDVGTTPLAILCLDDVLVEDLGHAVIDPLHYNEDYVNAAGYDFETGDLNTGWTLSSPTAIGITTEDKHSGEQALKAVNGSETDPESLQIQTPEITIKPNHEYKLFFWARAVGGGGKLSISTPEAGQFNAQNLPELDISNEWAQYVYEYSAGTTTLKGVGTTAKLNFNLGYIADKTYYIDDIYVVDLTEDPMDWTPGDAATQPLALNHSKFLGNVTAGSVPANWNKYWNQVSPENGGKWGTVQSNINNTTYSWTQANTAYNQANNNGLYFKWHTFVWGSQEPSGLANLTPEVQKTKLIAYMDSVKNRYPNIQLMDVVNEPFHETFSAAEALGGAGETGWDWIVTAFELARERFPKTKLLINEYGIINNVAAANDYMQIINILKEKHLIDGIGIQCHTFNIDGAPAADIQSVLDVLATADLPIYVSELDIADAVEKVQRKRYQEKFPILWEHPSVAGITLWGYITGSTWRDNTGIVSSAQNSATEREAMKWLKNYMVSDASKVENKFTKDVTLDEYRLSKAGTLEGAFDPAASAYKLKVDEEVTSINLALLTTDRLATVSGGDTRPLEEGINEITFTVTGEDKTTTKEYTLTVIRGIEPIKTEYIIQKLFPVTATTTINSNRTVDGLSLVSTGSNQIQILRANGGKTTEDGIYSNLPDAPVNGDTGMKNLLRFQTSGNINGSAMPTRCYASIQVPGECTITVYGMAGTSGGGRSILNISNGSYILGALDVSESAATLFKKTVKYYGEAGTIYFFVDNSTTAKNMYIGVIVVGTGSLEASLDGPNSKAFDFESGTLAGWSVNEGSGTIGISAEDKHIGQNSLKITSASATDAQLTTPVIPLIQGHHYRLSFWAKASADNSLLTLASGNDQLLLEKERSAIGSLPDKSIKTAWAQYIYDVVLTGTVLSKIEAASAELQLTLSAGSPETTYYLDDLTIEDMTAIEGSRGIPELTSPLANNHAKLLGNTVDSAIPEDFNTYWNQINAQNAGYWNTVEASQNTLSWEATDALYNYAKTNNIVFKYNALLDGNHEPAWLGDLPAADQKTAWETYIQAVATQYNAIDLIEVVNAPLHAPSAIRETLGGTGTSGYDWIVNAFETAKEKFPNSQLLISESGILDNLDNAALFVEIINVLKERNLLDGINIQGNQASIDAASIEQLTVILNTLESTNIPVYISDLNIDESLVATKFPVLWQHPAVVSVTWDSSSALEWLKNYFNLPASQVYNQYIVPENTPLAKNHSKFLGNVISGSVPANFDRYWNQITPENAGKWGSLEPARGYMRWAELDRAYAHAKKNGYPFKFHTFVWGSQEPGWITRTDLSSDELKAEVEDFMQSVAERYPDIDIMDVVNEALTGHNPSNIRAALGGNGTTGWDWVVWSFEKARQYFPNSQLLINDYGIISDNNAANNYKAIINILKERGLVDGIGIQGHQFNMDGVSVATMNTVLTNLATTGLPIYVTELDISNANETTQRNLYQQKFPVLWEHPSIAGVTVWGYITGQTWKENTGLVSSGNTDATEKLAMTWLKEYMSGTDSQVPNQFLSVDATLKTLTVSAGTLSPAFDPETLEYRIVAGADVSRIDLSPVANHKKATILGARTKALKPGINTVTIQVTAEDGTIRNYTLTIVRQVIVTPDTPVVSAVTYEPGKTLSDIAIESDSDKGTFSWATPDAIPTVDNAGYQVNFTPADNELYDYSACPLTQVIPLTVNPRDINNAAVTLLIEGTYVYTGAQLVPTYNSVKDGVYDLTSSDYNVQYGENSNVATGGSVILKGTGNYTGEKSFPFAIAKATPVITLEDKTVNYSGSPISIEQPVLSGSTTVQTLLAGLTYLYEGLNGVQYNSAQPPVDPGEYKLTVSTAGDANHTASSAQATLTILVWNGIDDVVVQAAINVYPNPVVPNGIVFVETNKDVNELDGAVIEVYTLTGSLVEQIPVKGKVTEVKIKGNSNAYLYVFRTKDGFRKEIKVIVE